MNNNRSSGVGRGQFWYTLNRRAVRGFPSSRHAAMWGLKRGLKGRDQLLKLVEGQAGQIQELRGADLYVGEPYTGHSWCLLSWEAQYTINRDTYNYSTNTVGNLDCAEISQEEIADSLDIAGYSADFRQMTESGKVALPMPPIFPHPLYNV
jgi:hypothetical protein